MAWMIALDCTVIVLLGAGIYYAWRLERMLRGLDKNRKDMETFLGVFSSTITRAEKGIRDLQDTAKDSGVEVDRSMARATALRDELNFLIDAADKVANRITNVSTEASARHPAPMQNFVEDEPLPPPVELPEEPYTPPPIDKLVPPWAKRATEKHVVINRNETKPAPAPTPVAAPADKSQKTLRSEAERELQQALEKMR
jgi:hypothetical protein